MKLDYSEPTHELAPTIGWPDGNVWFMEAWSSHHIYGECTRPARSRPDGLMQSSSYSRGDGCQLHPGMRK